MKNWKFFSNDAAERDFWDVEKESTSNRLFYDLASDR